jgi:hypothetical protein
VVLQESRLLAEDRGVSDRYHNYGRTGRTIVKIPFVKSTAQIIQEDGMVSASQKAHLYNRYKLWALLWFQGFRNASTYIQVASPRCMIRYRVIWTCCYRCIP